MSKKKITPDTEGKYKAMCQEYQEREELEKLNQQTRDRLKYVENAMRTRLAREFFEQAQHERRINAIGQMIITIILTLAICVSLAVIAWVEITLRPVLCILCAAALLAGTFRTGCFWNEFKR